MGKKTHIKVYLKGKSYDEVIAKMAIFSELTMRFNEFGDPDLKADGFWYSSFFNDLTEWEMISEKIDEILQEKGGEE